MAENCYCILIIYGNMDRSYDQCWTSHIPHILKHFTSLDKINFTQIFFRQLGVINYLFCFWIFFEEVFEYWIS